MFALEQVDCRDGEHEHRADAVTRCNSVDEFVLCVGVHEDLGEVGYLHAHGGHREGGTYGVLHPAVGDQDPEGGEVGAERHHSGDEQMLDACEAVPAEEEHADEGGFEEEGHQAFNGEWGAEHVADVVRVVGPVGAELEFHGDAGGDAHDEVDAEQDAPEFHHVAPDSAPGGDVDGLHYDQQNREPEGERHEQEVVQGGEAELHPGEVDDVHIRVLDGWV